jgi:hypothetical protein
MNYLALVSASVLALSAGTAAFADPINYTPDFTNATGLTYAGTAALTGGAVTLTSVNSQTTGAGFYATNALSIDPTVNFTSDFSFNIGAQSNDIAGNGFTFVLTSNPATLGTSSTNLGLGATPGTPSVEVQFSTFANATNNPTFAPGQYYSNLIAVSTDGNVVIPQSATSTYAAPYAVNECDNGANTKITRAGCLANGDIWQASISYVNGLLSVAVCDPKEAAGGTCTAGSFVTVINGYAISLASILGTGPVYAGFTSSNGKVTETVQIDSWSLNAVPEPASLAAFGIGLAALGMVRRRRSA